jgi:nitric oxide reductase subunit C
MLVHAPLTLLPLSLAVGLLAIWKRPGLAQAARILFLLGVISLIPAALAGLQAQQAMAHGPGSLVAEHRTWMLGTSAGALILALGLVPRFRPVVPPLVWLAGLTLLNLSLILGADRGALVAMRFHADLAKGIPLPRPDHPSLPESSASGAGTAPSTAGDPSRGGALFEQLACGSCHDSPDRREGTGIPPTLEHAGSKLQESWIHEYLQHPLRLRWLEDGVRPLSRMPDFQLTELESRDLAAFLTARTDTARFPEPALPWSVAAAESGRRLVDEYACRGCHVIGGAGGTVGPSLDATGARLRPAYLLAFLKAPKEIVPGTSMNDFHLWDEEAEAIALYLSSLGPAVEKEAAPAEGR